MMIDAVTESILFKRYDTQWFAVVFDTRQLLEASSDDGSGGASAAFELRRPRLTETP